MPDDDQQVSEKQMRGHLKIGVKPDISPDTQRLISRDLTYELDGVNIGSRLKRLKFEIEAMKPVEVELTLYLTGVEIDAPLADLLVKLQGLKDAEKDVEL